MGRVGRVLCGAGVLIATLVVETPALAREGDPDRQARRHELRQQLQAERERWRGEERGRGGWAPPPGHAPGSGYAAPPGGGRAPGHGAGGPYPAPPAYAPPPGYGAPPGYAPAPGHGGGPGWGGGHRLSPDERRALRQELRQQRP